MRASPCRKIAAVISLCAGMVMPALADDEEIIVTAGRQARPLSEIGQSVTVITEEELITRQSVSVLDALRLVPGLSFTRSGGPGTAASVFLRGGESAQTVALIDGVKLNDPASPQGGFDFGNLLIGNIERIEVVRGAQSLVWGSQAIGGVINFITRSPSERVHSNLRAEYGWRDSANVVGNVSGTLLGVQSSLGAGFFRSDGLSAFNAARGGQELDGYRNFGANAKFLVPLAHEVSLDLRGYYSNGKTQIDGFAPPAFEFGDTREESRTKELVAYAGLNGAFWQKRFTNRLGAAYTLTDRQNVDPDGIPAITFDSSGENIRLEYQGGLKILEGWDVSFGGETERSRFAAESSGGPIAIAQVRINGVYGQIHAQPLVGLTLTGGVRYDDHSQFRGVTTFSASGAYTPNDGKTLFRASFGEGFRAPSLFELFSDFGNPSLAPETSRGWDGGVTHALLGGKLILGASLFRRESFQQIQFVSCFGSLSPVCVNRPFGVYDNARRTRAQGAELQVAFQPSQRLALRVNYSYLDAIARGTGLRLARRPAHTANATFDYSWPFGLSAGATLTYAGPRFDDGGNLQELAGHVLIDARASYQLRKHLEIYGRIENLLQDEYETVLQFGSPRRGAFVGLRWAS